MTIAGGLELGAWVLSAIIAGWLVLDMLRIGRTHDERLLINAVEPGDGPAGPARTENAGGDTT